MSSVNALISKRLAKSEPSTKMAALAEKSAQGNLSSFNGIFNVTELSREEQEQLENLLKEHTQNDRPIEQDLKQLIALTSEVKAINHQAALLHGERIQKAQTILKNYREGAFTSWMIGVYGNRQTPYNLLHYFLFYNALPKDHRASIEALPRQAIYSLASREGPLEEKISFLLENRGKSKLELLHLMRDLFPLKERDKRREKPLIAALHCLDKAIDLLNRSRSKPSAKEQAAFKERLTLIQSFLKESS